MTNSEYLAAISALFRDLHMTGMQQDRYVETFRKARNLPLSMAEWHDVPLIMLRSALQSKLDRQRSH